MLEGFEVMRVLFSRANFSKALFAKLKLSEPFLKMTDEIRPKLYADLRERLAKDGIEITDLEIFKHEPEMLRQMEQQYIKESIEPATQRVSDNLHIVVNMLWGKLIQAAALSGANELREILEAPERKYSAQQIKDEVFRDEWELLKPIIGVSTGGARNVKHVWSDKDRECLASKYAELQPIWIEAKKIARLAQNSKEATRKKEWRKEVLGVYENLPADLLERFATLRGDDAKPSNIALLHAARSCLPPNVELSIGRLREEITAWKVKARS